MRVVPNYCKYSSNFPSALSYAFHLTGSVHIMHANMKAPIQGTDMAFPAARVKAVAGASEMSNFGEPEALAWWEDVGKQCEANISVGVRKRRCTSRGNKFIHIWVLKTFTGNFMHIIYGCRIVSYKAISWCFNISGCRYYGNQK